MTDTAPRANDDDLLRAITANLHLELGPAAQGLLVQSRQGIVTLSGRVDNVLARDQAVRSARNTRGALQVIDRIQVQGPAPQENARRQSVQRTLPGVPAR